MAWEEVRTMAKISIHGDIVSNDDKWIYDWFDVDSTSPADVKAVLDAAEEDEEIDVVINSGGGSVLAGQEIYTALRNDKRVTIKIESLAGSAAGVIAMAGKNQISPVGMVMIHNVSITGASGDYHEMNKNAELLQNMNAAMAEAYVQKSGMALDDVLALMDKETWLTANQCLEYGFVDELIPAQNVSYTNSFAGMWLTDEIRQKAEKEREQAKAKAEILKDLDDFGI